MKVIWTSETRYETSGYECTQCAMPPLPSSSQRLANALQLLAIPELHSDVFYQGRMNTESASCSAVSAVLDSTKSRSSSTRVMPCAKQHGRTFFQQCPHHTPAEALIQCMHWVLCVLHPVTAAQAFHLALRQGQPTYRATAQVAPELPCQLHTMTLF